MHNEITVSIVPLKSRLDVYIQASMIKHLSGIAAQKLSVTVDIVTSAICIRCATHPWMATFHVSHTLSRKLSLDGTFQENDRKYPR